MSDQPEDAKKTSDRREGDRRVAPDQKYAGPDRRQDKRRQGERRAEPRE